MTRKPYTQGRTFIGRLAGGDDLVATVTRIANEEGIKVGTIAAHGMLEGCVVSRINTETGMQEIVVYEGRMEIGSGSGTISQFKGRSMGRINAVLVARDGSIIAGTLSIGCQVYACEVVITEYTGGGVLSRDFDAETGLPLWKGVIS